MKKIIIIDNIHQAAINILKKRKDFSYEVLENFDLIFLPPWEIERISNNSVHLKLEGSVAFPVS